MRLLDVTLKLVRAGSQGSNSTRESRLSRVRFNPWEPALMGQIRPVRVGSHGSDSTRESRLSRVKYNPWEPALTGQTLPLRVLFHFGQAQPKVKVNSRWFQFQLRLRLALCPDNLETHTPGTVVSKTRSGLLLYYFMTNLWFDYSKIKWQMSLWC